MKVNEMAKPKNLSDLPNTSPYYLIFRKVGEFMTCESYTDRKELEKVISDLEYDRIDYRIVKATNISAEVKVVLTETGQVATRTGVLGTGIYGSSTER